VSSQPPPPPPRIGLVQGSTADASHYTPWFTRVVAYVIDSIPVYLLAIIGGVVLSVFRQVETICVSGASCTSDSAPSTTAWIIFSVCVLIAMVFTLWNFVVRQGNTGSSIGKQMMKFKVVGEQAQQPIGVFKSLLRQMAHGIDALICYVGFLFPLWDAKRQTIADKLMKTVCVPL
jgi:uncharacterized RDD family membrane protein YckC